MAEERSLSDKDATQRDLWSAKKHVIVTVAEPETVGTHYYLLEAKTVSYFAVYLPRILDYFARYTSTSTTKRGSPTRWFLEYKGIRLPWNRPIGALLDVFAVDSKPWRLTLKWDESPQSLALSEPIDDSIRDYWTNQFKEAAYIRDGSANSVLSLSRDASQSLWRAISEEGTAQDFWQHAGPLLHPHDMRNVPVKIYDGLNVTQKLIPARQEGQLRTGRELSELTGCKLPENQLDLPLVDIYQQHMYPDGFLHLRKSPVTLG